MNRRGLLERVAGIALELTVVKKFYLAHWPRLVCDILLFRVMRLTHIPREGTPRTVRMRDGTLLTYRLNRGDIQAIREIWRDEVYMPGPDLTEVRQVVDLGANIGFSSLYLCRHLNIEYLVAVEPDPANASILRRNFQQNAVNATVVEAAVGPADGHAAFRRTRASNVGHLDNNGDLGVRLVSMPHVMEYLVGKSAPTLLKMDVEGAEEQLFTGDVSWLHGFDCLMAELHPHAADIDRIVGMIEESGLHFRDGEGPGGPTPCWVRPGVLGGAR